MRAITTRRCLALGALTLGLAVTPAAGAADVCDNELDPLVTRLVNIDSQLDDDGMYWPQYRVAVRRAVAAHNRIPINQLSDECIINVGVPAERATNRYITARNIWAGYVEQGQRVPPRKVRQMQRLWDQAAVLIKRAVNGM